MPFYLKGTYHPFFALKSSSVPTAMPPQRKRYKKDHKFSHLLNSLTSGGYALCAGPYSRKKAIKIKLGPPLAPFGAHEAPVL